MNYWLIADPHMGHRLLETEEYGSRPSKFEDIILKNLQLIQPNDVLISLGDNSFYNHEYWNARLTEAVHSSVKKWLVLGNHDKKSIKWYLSNGWDFAASEIRLALYGFNIILSHIPVNNCYDFVNVHGHLHTKQHRDFKQSSSHFLVSMELNNYRPVSLRSILGA